MTISASSLLNNDGVEISQSVYLPKGLAIQFTYRGRTYLKAGNILVTGFDTTVHQGAYAGSSTPSSEGGTDEYIRVQLA